MMDAHIGPRYYFSRWRKHEPTLNRYIYDEPGCVNGIYVNDMRVEELEVGCRIHYRCAVRTAPCNWVACECQHDERHGRREARPRGFPGRHVIVVAEERLKTSRAGRSLEERGCRQVADAVEAHVDVPKPWA